MRLDEFYDAVQLSPRRNIPQGLWMVRDYARAYRHLFESDMDAFLGGVIAGICGSKGGRIAVLLATVDTGSVDRYFVPEEAGR